MIGISHIWSKIDFVEKATHLKNKEVFYYISVTLIKNADHERINGTVPCGFPLTFAMS